MCDLYPFNAVMPVDNSKYKYKIHDNFLHIKDMHVATSGIGFKDDEGIKHVINMIGRNFLQRQPKKYLY